MQANSPLPEGSLIPLTVDAIAHGAHCVARYEGQVVFVRHAIPGERVIAKVTGKGKKGRWLTADAIEIVHASPDRVTPPCTYARPGGCGGCDFQHIDVAAQRLLKKQIITEQMIRMAGLDADAIPRFDVRPVGNGSGLRWRTRVEFAVDTEGRAGLHPWHSNSVIGINECLIATDAVNTLDVPNKTWPGKDSVLAVSPSVGSPIALTGTYNPSIIEHAAGREWSVAAQGFWQVHPDAADALVDAVRAAIRDVPCSHLLDLYSGVGLFGLSLMGNGRVTLVESDVRACREARTNSATVAERTRIITSRVDRWLESIDPRRVRPDVIVLDPPRSGAGQDTMRRIVALGAKRIVYVACDPSALARDTAVALAEGWTLTGLDALDLFPMTGHVETIATFSQPA